MISQKRIIYKQPFAFQFRVFTTSFFNYHFLGHRFKTYSNMSPYQQSYSGGDQIVSDKSQPKEILYDGYFYDVTNFARRHPGGREIISYFTEANEDATIAIQQFHGRTIEKVHGIMKSLKSRPAHQISENCDDEETKKNRALTKDFTKLYLELKAEGLFEPSYTHVAQRIAEIFLFALLGCYLITQFNNPWIKFVGCFVFTMAQGRAGWVMHEAGHLSLTGSPKYDRLLQAILVGSLMGWSGIFWRRHHSLHHAMAQRIRRDLDIDLKPLLLINTEGLDDPVKDQTFLLRNQVYFAPIGAIFVTSYWLFWETGKNLLKFKIGVEFIAVGIHYLIAYQIGFWPWVGSYTMLSFYLNINFALSHSHLPVTNKPTHWVEHGLTHSADVEQRPWCDWWMGYLNYQIEHHLFPTMPQFRNRLVVDRVKALAEKHGLPYHVFSYREAVIKTVKNVLDVSQELKHLNESKAKQ